jgi:AsmA protein
MDETKIGGRDHMRRTRNTLLIAAASVVGIVIVAVAVLFLTVSPAAYKGVILAQLEQATGRKATIAGGLSLSLFPEVGITAAGVSLAGPAGSGEPEMVQAKRLDVAVALMPLISGRLKIDRFLLVDPVIRLVIDAKGRPNWNFGVAASPAPAPAAPATSALAALSRFSVGEMRVQNGDVSFTDRRTGATEELQQVNLTIAIPSLDQPATFSGSARWRDTPVSISATLTDPGAIMSIGGKSALSLSLSAQPVSARLDGTLVGTGSATSPLGFDGTATVSMPSVRKFVAWSNLGLILPAHGFGPFSLSGKVHDANGVAQFSNAQFQLDSLKATGVVTVVTQGSRLAATATLAAGTVDFNPYLGPSAASPRQRGWSSTPFDLAPLRQIDLDLALTADGIHYRRLTIGKSDVVLHLKNSQLVVDLKALSLYQGTVKGEVQLDTTKPKTRIAANVSASGIALHRFLDDLAGISSIDGAGSGDLDVTATGDSELALVRSLGGKGEFRMAHGALGGVDLNGMLRNAASAFQRSGSTAISVASGHFTIRKGIVRNPDLRADLSGIDASGAGTINLPNRTLDYRVTPKLIAGIVTVPVIVSGPWDNLSYRPDLAGIAGGLIETPGRAVEGAAGLGTNLGKGVGSGIGNTLKGLFGH